MENRNDLKKALINKTQIERSANFDSTFFAKLEKERHGIFSGWFAWTISGCATLCVLFMAVTTYTTPVKRTFNHQEYVSSTLEIQNSMNEDVSSEDLEGLTTSSYDEI